MTDVLISLRTLCFLRSGDRVLLLHRRNPPNAGLWNGIGGKLEPGEDPSAGCVREVAEETGMTIAAPQLKALLVVTAQTPPALWVIFVFTALVAESPVGPSEEGELAWVDLAALPSIPLPPDVPMIIPRLLTEGEVLVLRAEYGTEDPKTLARLEVMGT